MSEGLRKMVVIDAPDIVAGADLADRLSGYGPKLSSNGDDGCRLTIPSAQAHVLRTVLSTAHEWARHWGLQHVPLRLGSRSYTLGSKPEQRRAGQPKLLFFHSRRSGECRRAEALVAQVLQRRRNHETFELVRVSVDTRPELAREYGVEEIPAVLVLDDGRVAARLVSLHYSHEIEAALQPWLR
jgi:hypothetical protein